MLKKLFSLFSNQQSTYSFFRLHANLTKWQKEGYKPWAHELPEKIVLDSSFWKKIVEIKKQTDSDGRERAFAVFFADGELILTEVTKGTNSSVTTNSKVEVKYLPSRSKGYFVREIYADGGLISKKELYHKRAPKKIDIKYLFNIHTHPPHNINGVSKYSFFSNTDVNTLLSSSALISAMVGDKLWLLFKTNKSPAASNTVESELSVKTLTENMNIVVYCADLEKPLYKLSS